MLFLAAALSLVQFVVAQTATSYTLDDSRGPARTLDGIAGLSGGGATSVFLPAYPAQQQSEILDFLFLPNFGASFHMLKVEIGGDAQSTDGAESSHMHDPFTTDYSTGYEWWLMNEAKKRNPDILLYGLSWAFPQWLTCAPGTQVNCTGDIYTYPQQTADYITSWIYGAKTVYGLDIDYVGSWNERPYNSTYLKLLRTTLDTAGFNNTRIVAPDSDWSIAGEILTDPVLAEAVHAIGCHYPGTYSTPQAEQTGKPLWASEDDSTLSNAVGAECWARVINRNYVNGNMTASINWNLLSAYMKGTNWYRAGIFNAMSPYNGAYGTLNADGSFTVGPMVWATAHTTQATRVGWSYLATAQTLGAPGTGSGELAYGGTYVTVKDFTSGDFSIIIEKVTRNHSSCVRPYLSPYDTAPEVATFQLAGGLKSVTSLNLFYSHFAYYEGDQSVEFEGPTVVAISADGTFTLNITEDSLYTLTTLTTLKKGSYAQPPAPVLFPQAHTDDFESCVPPSEAPYFTDQNGIFQCVESNDTGRGIVMKQYVPLRPVTWGGDIRPHSLIGHRDSKNQSMVVDGKICEEGSSIMLGLRMQGTDDSIGILFAVDTDSAWGVWTSIGGVDYPAFASGSSAVTIGVNEWLAYRMDVNGSFLNVWIEDYPIVVNLNISSITMSGHGLIGTKEYGQYSEYDNFQLYTSYTQCGGTPPVAGASISVVECSSEVGPIAGSQFSFTPFTPNGWEGTFSLYSSAKTLCIAAIPNGGDQDPWYLQLAPCNTSDPNQSWHWIFDGISPDQERASAIRNEPSGRCMDIFNADPEIGAAMDAWPCNSGSNQNFWYDFDVAEISSEASSTCLGVC